MASRMRTTVTLGNWSVTSLKIASSASGVAFTVARKVCGALSSMPGEKTKTKLIDSVCHSMRRSEAMRGLDVAAEHVDRDGVAEPMPKACASSASNETSWGPR